MEKCTRMRTTNPDELFNAQLWRRAPKHLPVNKNNVSTAVSMAVLEFNKGANGLYDVFSMLDIRDGYYFALHASSSFWKRHLDAARHANETSKKKRLRRKNCSKQDRLICMLPRREFCMKQEASIIRNLLFYTLQHYIVFFAPNV